MSYALSSESMAASVDWMWSLICQLCLLWTFIVRNCSFAKAHVSRQTQPDKNYGSFTPALSHWARCTVLGIIFLSPEPQRTRRPLSQSLPQKLYSLILVWGSALITPLNKKFYATGARVGRMAVKNTEKFIWTGLFKSWSPMACHNPPSSYIRINRKFSFACLDLNEP